MSELDLLSGLNKQGFNQQTTALNEQLAQQDVSQMSTLDKLGQIGQIATRAIQGRGPGQKPRAADILAQIAGGVSPQQLSAPEKIALVEFQTKQMALQGQILENAQKKFNLEKGQRAEAMANAMAQTKKLIQFAKVIESQNTDEAKQQMYTRLLPQIKKLLPEAEDTYDSDLGVALIAQDPKIQEQLSNNPELLRLVGIEDKKVELEMSSTEGQQIQDVMKLKEAGQIEAATQLEKRLGVEQARKDAEATEKALKNTFDKATRLRNDFDKGIGEYKVIRDAFRKIEAVSEDKSAAGDLSLVFAYMKMLDPTSSVRESEFANAENAQGVPGRIRSLWNRLQSGEFLGAAQRKDFLKQAKNIMKAQKVSFDERVKSYTGLAERNNVDVRDVITLETNPPQTDAEVKSAIKAGDRLISSDMMTSLPENVQSLVEKARQRGFSDAQIMQRLRKRGLINE